MKRTKENGLVLIGNLVLFTMAYVPLILMFAALVFPSDQFLSLVLTIFAIIVACVGRISVGRSTKQRSVFEEQIAGVANDGRASMAYLATYILPFISGVPDSPEKWVAAVIYVATLFVVFSQTDVRSVNPTLFIFGIKVAKITLKGSSAELEAICLSTVKVNDRVTVSNFGGATVVDLRAHKA